MKKRILSVIICLAMILTFIPNAVMAAADAPNFIKICGIQLDSGDYLASNSATTASSNYTEGDKYVALYKDGVLKLNGLDIVNTATGSVEDDHAIYWSRHFSGDGTRSITIELAEGSTNNIVDEKWSAINGAHGSGTNGPSVTIQGKGTLNVTGGSFGIWVWTNIIVQKGATVNVIGKTKGAVCNNTSGGSIIIKQGTNVNFIGETTYGVQSDNSAVGKFIVQGGNLTVKGKTAAVNKINSDFGGNTVYVSNDFDGANATVWNNTTALTNYKYISLSGFSNTVTTYNVNKAQVENGTIDVDFARSMADETITVTATPAAGYKTNSVTVTDADSGNVVVTGTKNVRTFTMPAKNVTVSATFTAVQSTGTNLVSVGDTALGDGEETTYYKNGDTTALTGSASDYNAKLEKINDVLTLTLKDLDYNGSDCGINSTADLKIVLEGSNNIKSASDYGIYTDKNLEIEGTVNSSLNVESVNSNAIMAYDRWQGYNESITISNANITATAGDVGIVAPKALTIKDSVINATGKKHGLQGGKFTSSSPANITVENSTITAVSNNGPAFKSAPIVAEDYQWREENGEWKVYDSADSDFASAKYVEFKPGVPSGSIVPGPSTPSTYTVTFDANGGSVTPADDITTAEGKLTALPTPIMSNTRYTFLGWFTAPVDGTPITTDTVFTANTTIYAQWKYRSSGSGGSKCIIKFNSNGGSVVTGYTVARNSIISEPAAPTKENCKFEGWYTDKELTKAYDFSSRVTSGFTLYAKWSGSEINTDNNAHNCPSKAFADLDTTLWYHEDTDFVIENNIMVGMDNKTFAPNGNLTRGMLVTILYRSEGEPATNKSIPFADIDMGAYYANAVVWAQQNEIVKGMSETEYAPDLNITREQLATIMFRYAQFKGMEAVTMEENLNFTDASAIAEWAVSAMNWGVGRNYIFSRNEGKINPKEAATRAEIAAFIHRYIEDNTK